MNCVANLDKGKPRNENELSQKDTRIRKTPVAKAKPENRKLPPDPYGDFKSGAAMGKKVIALYEELSPGLEGEYLVSNIVRDLICLSARDPKLGNVDTECICNRDVPRFRRGKHVKSAMVR